MHMLHVPHVQIKELGRWYSHICAAKQHVRVYITIWLLQLKLQVRGLCHGTETLLREAEERASQQHADSLLHRAARNLSMLIDPSGQESWATTVLTGL